jgi:hypothetical protein
MSLQNDGRTPITTIHPVVLEIGIVTALLVGVYLWRELVSQVLTTVFGRPPSVGGVFVSGLVNGGVLLFGLIGFTVAYSRFREIDLGRRLPSRKAVPLVGLAVLTPIICVALTKLVGVVTGVPYNALTKTSIAADASVLPILLIAGLGLIIGVPMLVVICQVLIQASFEQVVSADTAIVLTTAVAGFVMVSNTGGLATVPELGKLIGAIAFTLSLGVAVYANERLENDWLRYLGFAPVVFVTAIIVFAGIAEVGTVAGGVFAVTQLAVLGIAAYTYDRTASLLAPALAYAALLLANRIVVFVFEAGMQSW